VVQNFRKALKIGFISLGLSSLEKSYWKIRYDFEANTWNARASSI